MVPNTQEQNKEVGTEIPFLFSDIDRTADYEAYKQIAPQASRWQRFGSMFMENAVDRSSRDLMAAIDYATEAQHGNLQAISPAEYDLLNVQAQKPEASAEELNKKYNTNKFKTPMNPDLARWYLYNVEHAEKNRFIINQGEGSGTLLQLAGGATSLLAPSVLATTMTGNAFLGTTANIGKVVAANLGESVVSTAMIDQVDQQYAGVEPMETEDALMSVGIQTVLGTGIHFGVTKYTKYAQAKAEKLKIEKAKLEEIQKVEAEKNLSEADLERFKNGEDVWELKEGDKTPEQVMLENDQKIKDIEAKLEEATNNARAKEVEVAPTNKELVEDGIVSKEKIEGAEGSTLKKVLTDFSEEDRTVITTKVEELNDSSASVDLKTIVEDSVPKIKIEKVEEFHSSIVEDIGKDRKVLLGLSEIDGVKSFELDYHRVVQEDFASNKPTKFYIATDFTKFTKNLDFFETTKGKKYLNKIKGIKDLEKIARLNKLEAVKYDNKIYVFKQDAVKEAGTYRPNLKDTDIIKPEHKILEKIQEHPAFGGEAQVKVSESFRELEDIKLPTTPKIIEVKSANQQLQATLKERADSRMLDSKVLKELENLKKVEEEFTLNETITKQAIYCLKGKE